LERATPPPPPPPPPKPGPATEAVEEDETRPATLGEVRSLRRWLVVTGVWAVAASAIAIIALLEVGQDDTRDPNVATVGQLNRFQQNVNERVDELESRIDELPTSSDVQRLERRLRQAENRASGARDDASAVRSDLDDLQQRVEDLESQQDTGGTGGAEPDQQP
jgi:septal ring factor EnvC (AmiA/AmiB activator)